MQKTLKFYVHVTGSVLIVSCEKTRFSKEAIRSFIKFQFVLETFIPSYSGFIISIWLHKNVV